MIYFDSVLWHINYCRSFNAKSTLYIYIRYMWFTLIRFYGISTTLGYLMPNLLYTYILDIYDLIGIILRWGFLIWELIFYLLRTFCPQLRFGQISSLAFFRWLTATSGPVAQRIEALSLYGSRWALSEDSGFNSYPSRPEGYLIKMWCDRQQLWKSVITGGTVTKTQ